MPLDLNDTYELSRAIHQGVGHALNDHRSSNYPEYLTSEEMAFRIVCARVSNGNELSNDALIDGALEIARGIAARGWNIRR